MFLDRIVMICRRSLEPDRIPSRRCPAHGRRPHRGRHQVQAGDRRRQADRSAAQTRRRAPAIFDGLEAKDAASFDKAYVDAQDKAHVETVDLFNDSARGGDNARLKAFAVELLPTLQSHLEHVSRMRSQKWYRVANRPLSRLHGATFPVWSSYSQNK